MTDNIPDNEKPKQETADIAAEFAEVGRKLRETINVAWNSQERRKIQAEVQDGLQRLVKEVDEAVKTLRETEPGQKVETGVKQIREDIESGKVGDEIRKGLVTALRGLSDALDKMASSFTPLEEDQEKKE
jgi:hypothetical protein